MNNPIDYWYQKYLQEKKRADNLQSAIEVAEDHAYLAGQEAMREQMIDKAAEWLKEQDEMVGISFQDDFIERFKKEMEE